jgi:hypothetical protein
MTHIEEAARPHVSALLWEDLLGTPFTPNPQVAEQPKTRGRPRKYGLPVVEGLNKHTMSDEELDTRNLLQNTIDSLILDYKEYVQEGKKPKEALVLIGELYRIPYAQAFNICADII